MRITVVSTPIFSLPLGNYGGLEHIAYQTAEGLAKKGHEVTLIAPDGSYCSGCRIINNGAAGQIDEKRAFSLYRDHLLDQDVIIDETWMKFSYLLKAMGELKCPVLGVMHAPVNTMYGSLPPVENPCIVCISDDQANHFEALFDRKARVCKNGIDVNFYRSIGIPRTDRYLFLARFSTIKGPDLAIQACLEAGVGLDLVGDTSITNEPEYLEKCKKMCDGKQIKLIGPASRGECVYWFSQAKALLHLNQRFREPLGLAPLEAMSCGCPVIAWDRGAMRETIVDGKTGILVNSLKEAVEVIKQDGINKDIRNFCRQQAEKFTVDRMVNRYEELCIEAIQTGGW